MPKTWLEQRTRKSNAWWMATIQRQIAKAQAIRDAVPEVVASVIEAKVPTVEGMHTRIVWKFEVTDLAALMKGVLAGKVPAEAV